MDLSTESLRHLIGHLPNSAAVMQDARLGLAWVRGHDSEHIWHPEEVECGQCAAWRCLKMLAEARAVENAPPIGSVPAAKVETLLAGLERGVDEVLRYIEHQWANERRTDDKRIERDLRAALAGSVGRWQPASDKRALRNPPAEGGSHDE